MSAGLARSGLRITIHSAFSRLCAELHKREIIGREVIDEVIYRCRNARDRLILELEGRCGLRIGEVQGLTKRPM